MLVCVDDYGHRGLLLKIHAIGFKTQCADNFRSPTVSSLFACHRPVRPSTRFGVPRTAEVLLPDKTSPTCRACHLEPVRVPGHFGTNRQTAVRSIAISPTLRNLKSLGSTKMRPSRAGDLPISFHCLVPRQAVEPKFLIWSIPDKTSAASQSDSPKSTAQPTTRS